MARADLLISLVKAGATGDQGLFRRTVEAMVAEERAKHHGVLAGQLEEQMNRNGALARMDAVWNRMNMRAALVPCRRGGRSSFVRCSRASRELSIWEGRSGVG